VAKTYQLDTMASPSSLLARARRAARKNGAILVGDERSGRFSHELVRGEYRMAGQRVVVTITDKYWLLPWPIVEVRLRELLASAWEGAGGVASGL
jgi:hypothetical protein